MSTLCICGDGGFHGSEWDPCFPMPLAPLPPSMALPGLSLAPGRKIQEQVWRKFGLPISWPDLGHSSFDMVVSFDRCKFRLSPESVGLLLPGTIGGSASHCHVSHLLDHVFKFFVCSKVMGFFVKNLVCFECNLFKLFFHLRGGGGPN